MHLIKLLCALLASFVFFACGPEAPHVNRLIGTYSSRGAVYSTNDSSVVHYEILDDGRFTIVSVGADAGEQCNNVRGTATEYSWKPYGEDEIEVSFPDRAMGGVEAWRISRGGACSMRVRLVQEGKVSTNFQEYTRGAVCLAVPTCLPGPACSGCNLVWCDEPPPPCDDDESASN